MHDACERDSAYKLMMNAVDELGPSAGDVFYASASNPVAATFHAIMVTLFYRLVVRITHIHAIGSSRVSATCTFSEKLERNISVTQSRRITVVVRSVSATSRRVN